MRAADRHQLASAALSGAVALAGLAGLDWPLALQVAGLALSVAVVGLPHGGLDHRVGRALCEPLAGRWWPAPFLTSYLATGALVLAGWAVLPLATAGLFFLVSAYHFADTESPPLWRGMIFGGMPVWLTLLARPAETLTLLAWVMPDAPDLGASYAALRPGLFLLAGVAAGAWLVDLTRGQLAESARLLAAALMFVYAPVLVGFAAYFCGWHSLRELGKLAARADPANPRRGLRRVLVLAAPSALAAALMATGGAWAFAAGKELTPAVVQAVFLGLSAVAVPHIILHKLAARAGVDAFGPQLAGQFTEAGGRECSSTTSSPAAASSPA